MFFLKYYCPKCRSIRNRLQVAYGTDNVMFHWYRCRTCGQEVESLKSAIEALLSNSKNEISI